MKVSKAIEQFLIGRSNRNNCDLIRRWTPEMETQVNVDPKKGTPVEGKKGVWVYEDKHDSFEYKNIRIPYNARISPEFIDFELEFSLSTVVQGVGCSGWNWKLGLSQFVGFDFDAIAGHRDGLTAEQMREVENALRRLEYAEVRCSTGGAGLHVYVPLADVPAQNHKVHADIARSVLEKMSKDCHFEFNSRIDKLGQILWIWHSKMSLENGGLKLLKESTRSLSADELDLTLVSPQAIVKSQTCIALAADEVIQQFRQRIDRNWEPLNDRRKRTTFSLAGYLASFEDGNGNRKLTDDQILDLLRYWNAKNLPPLNEETLLHHAEGGLRRGTPRPAHILDEDLHDSEETHVSRSLTSTNPPESSTTRTQFPVECLPAPLAAYVDSVSESLTCDASYVALPLLCALTRTITNKVVIKLKNDWYEPAILWGVIVGLSGDGKTPAMREVGRFLQVRQAELMREHAELTNAFEEESKVYKIRFSAWEGMAKKASVDSPLTPSPVAPVAPIVERLYVSDTTIEALVLVLSLQKPGLLLWRQELNGWFGSFGEFKKKGGNDHAHWLQLFDGDEVNVIRKGDNAKGMYVRRASVSIFGGIQPGILSNLDSNHLKSGLIARMLFAWPDDQPMGWSDSTIDPLLSEDVQALFDRLLAVETPDHPREVALTSAAQALFKQYVKRNSKEIQNLDDDLRTAWVKLKSYVGRLSLVIGMVKNESVVDVESVHSAICLADWFGQEARRVYTLFQEPGHLPNDTEVLGLILKKGKSVTVGELQKWSRKWRAPAAAQAALDKLVSANYLVQRGNRYHLAG